MQVKISTCIACGKCLPNCIVGAISFKRDKNLKKVSAYIDHEVCLECSNCLRMTDCPTDSLYEEKEIFEKRGIRKVFSDPKATHKETNIPGRGTEEVKTNDITGRFPPGKVGVAMEFGRPGIGAYFKDIEKVTTELAGYDVHFESDNPLTFLIEDIETGKFKVEAKGQKILSGIVEILIDLEQLPQILKVAKEVAQEIDTVFSMSVITKYDTEGKIPVLEYLEKAQIIPRPNAKINVGLGRPLFEERSQEK